MNGRYRALILRAILLVNGMSNLIPDHRCRRNEMDRGFWLPEIGDDAGKIFETPGEPPLYCLHSKT